MESRRPSDSAAAERPRPSRDSGDTSTLLRLGWMLAGPALLAVLALLIGFGATWTFSAKDLLFWFGVIAVVALRYADVVHHRGLTVYGEPATRRDLGRYSVGLVATCAVAWVAAQSMQRVAE